MSKSINAVPILVKQKSLTKAQGSYNRNYTITAANK